MMPQEIDDMLNFSYFKMAAELAEKATAKAAALEAKAAEREKRVADLRRDFQIDDGALIQILNQARQAQNEHRHFTSLSYSNKMVTTTGGERLEERTIGAGPVNFLLTETDFIAQEVAAAKRLKMIARNLKPKVCHTDAGEVYLNDQFQVSEEDLDYLGF